MGNTILYASIIVCFSAKVKGFPSRLFSTRASEIKRLKSSSRLLLAPQNRQTSVEICQFLSMGYNKDCFHFCVLLRTLAENEILAYARINQLTLMKSSALPKMK